ncbi:unnamed protein product [Tenebrio molitor]|nr:unnamed protein product [Tenebrio molitor]
MPHYGLSFLILDSFNVTHNSFQFHSAFFFNVDNSKS